MKGEGGFLSTERPIPDYLYALKTKIVNTHIILEKPSIFCKRMALDDFLK